MDHQRAGVIYAVERYLLDELTPEEREEFEEHFFACPECGEAVRTGAFFADNARAVMAEEASVRPAVPGKAGSRRLIPGRFNWGRWTPGLAAAAVALAAVTGYQNLVQIPGLRQQARGSDTPQVVMLATLRPQARGEKPVVKAEGEPVVLNLELNGQTVLPAYKVDIRTESGGILYSIPHASAEDGSIQLELPAKELQPGNYEILVRRPVGESGGGAEDPEVGRYDFQIEK